MLTIVLIVLAALVGLLLCVAALRPDTFEVTRSRTIPASAEAVFPHINDLRLAHVWSPWVKLDPAARYVFGEPSAGVGATMSWDGNKQAGAGRQTIVESEPARLVRIKVEFFRPFQGGSVVTFALQPQGSSTVVSWTMAGKNNFLFKVVGIFCSQDKMFGATFEEGLGNLERVIQTSP